MCKSRKCERRLGIWGTWQRRGTMAGGRWKGSSVRLRSRYSRTLRLVSQENDTISSCCSFHTLRVFALSSRYDEDHSGDDKVFLDCFCKIAAGIKNNSNGHQLKDLILQKGITQSALDYMKKHIPSAKK